MNHTLNICMHNKYLLHTYIYSFRFSIFIILKFRGFKLLKRQSKVDFWAAKKSGALFEFWIIVVVWSRVAAVYMRDGYGIKNVRWLEADCLSSCDHCVIIICMARPTAWTVDTQGDPADSDFVQQSISLPLMTMLKIWSTQGSCLINKHRWQSSGKSAR